MKIRRLFLRAFGPFTDEVLDFSASGDAGLHIISGPNEAGKSTSLRAVRGLLFGIPHATVDAHHHPGPKLCVGAEITANEQTTQFFRYKKRTASLFDEAGNSVPEESLSALLGGLDETTFSRRIGLDQYELEHGADALLGGSEEGLFAAGTGGAEVRTLLESLRVRGGELYKKTGKTPLLNVSLAHYAEEKSAFTGSIRPPQAYEDQRQAYESAQNELKGLVLQRRKLREEQREGNRLQSVLADLSAFQEEEEGLAALGEVVLLPAQATEEREKQERELRDVEAVARELARDMLKTEADLSALPAPSLLETSDFAIGPLEDSLGSERKAMNDLPTLRGRLDGSEEDLRGLSRRLGFSLKDGDVFDAVEALLPPESAVVGLRSAHAELSKRDEARRVVLLQTQELERELGTREKGSEEINRDLAFLQAAHTEGVAARPTIERALELHQETRLQAERLEAAKALLPGIKLSELGNAPSREQIDKVQNELNRLSAEIANLKRNISESEKKLGGFRRELSSLLGNTKLLRESDLDDARKARELAFAKFLENRQNPALLESFSETVRAADHVVDELRANAQTLSRVEGLERSISECERILHDENSLLERLVGEKTAATTRISEKFEAMGLVSAREPDEWRRIESRIVDLGETLRLHGEAESRFSALKTVLDELTERLRGATRAFLPKADSLKLTGLIEALGREVEVCLTAERERELQENQRESEEKRLAQASAKLVEADGQVAAAAGVLAERLSSLGLPRSLRGDELEVVLRGLAEMQQKLLEGRELKRRVDGIARDTSALGARLREVAARFQLELPTGDLLSVGEGLSKAVKQARARAEERERLVKAKLEREERGREAEERSAEAKHHLSRLAKAAGVDSPAELPRAEARSAEAQRRTLRRQELRTKILEAAGGETFSALALRAKSVTQAALSVRLEEVSDELERVEEEVRRLEANVTSLELALDRYRTVDVAGARQQLATRAAEARGLLEEYIRTELARQLLSEQMEEFAKSFTGQLAQRSGEIFSTLTLGKYSGLEFVSGERTLRCKHGTASKEVSELSRGTRAQLYFALRVASLESYFSTNRPVPLVLDDFFVDFDDERVAAAFGVLGKLSELTQILYFTHLSRDAELAASAVSRVGLHTLGVS